jgi:hypothetical protein
MGIDTGICFLSLVLIPKKLLLRHGFAIELLLMVLSLSSVVVLFNPRSAPISLHISNLLELVKVQSRSRVTGHARIFRSVEMWNTSCTLAMLDGNLTL